MDQWLKQQPLKRKQESVQATASTESAETCTPDARIDTNEEDDTRKQRKIVRVTVVIIVMAHSAEHPAAETVDLWSYGIPNEAASDLREVTFEESQRDLRHYMHAAHAMIYARDDTVLWDKYNVTANILMQMRFDGNLGFAGGLLDKGSESAAEGLNRELEEELNLDLKKYSLSQEDHICTHVNDKKKLVMHFYAKEFAKSEFLDIERNALCAKEWGVESLGILRVPLYLVDDNVRGFPLFLSNQFAGSAREQLLIAISKRKILTREQLNHFTDCYRKHAGLSST